MSGKLRVSIRAKNANAQTDTPTAPTRYTGRRPNRSDSAPHIGMVTKCTTAPMSTAPRTNEVSVSYRATR